MENSCSLSSSHVNIAFADLPFDTLVHIMLFVAPHEILILRKCCKKLYEISYKRVVWTDALERVTSCLDIFRPSFPLDQMSMRDLEHAATSPHRLSSRLIRDLNIDSVLKPCVTRILTPLDEDTSVSDMLLVPGGRFLITRESSGFVRIWDLGFSADVAIRHHPLASVRVQHSLVTLLAQSNFHGTSILILVYSGNNILQVYEVFPTSKSPDFHLVSEIRTDSDGKLAVLCFHSDRVAFQQGDTRIGLWNFYENTWITWEYKDDKPMDAVLAGDEIIVIGNKHMSIWEIPLLQPYRISVKATVEHKPLLILAHSTGHSGGEAFIAVSFPRWTSYLAFASMPNFGIMGAGSEGEGIIKQYILPTIRGQQDDSLPRTIPIYACSYQTTGHHIPRMINSGMLPAGEVFYAWDDRVNLMMNITTITKRNRTPSFTKTGLLWRFCNGSEALSALCSTSGRLCVMSNKEIRVIDHLSPPPRYD